MKKSFVSWNSKKKNYVFLSTAEFEYIVIVLCCVQIIWIHQLSDYDLSLKLVKIFGIILVLFVSLKIMCIILEQYILILSIISLEVTY